MNPANSTNPPASPSRRVESWLYVVINPLLEALPVELGFLERGASTWRFHTGDFEYLRPIERYLRPDGRHVLRDFLKSNLDASARFEEHDNLLTGVRDGSRLAHNALVARPGFVDQVQAALQRFLSADSERRAPFGGFPAERFPGLVAERVVNAVEVLPPHQSDAAFWSDHGDEFARLGTGAAFDSLRTAQRALVESDRGLIAWLEDQSFELCTHYDVPAAPFSRSF